MNRAGPAVLLLALVALSGVGAAAVLADTPPPTTETTGTATGGTDTTPTSTEPAATVPDGVVLGGVPVGGLGPDAAAAAVELAFRRPVVLAIDKTRVRVAPGAFGIAVPTEAAVQKALTVPPGTVLGLRAGVDRQLVGSYVATLARRFDRKPVDARLTLRKLKPLVTQARPGRVLQQRAIAEALTSELVHGTRSTIPLRARSIAPRIGNAAIGPAIVIKRGSNLLTLYDKMRAVRTFRVATGQRVYPTPLGRFQIVVKWKNPWWYPPADPWAAGDKPVPPGPGNPLGTRWMGISSPGVGIHGTPEDGSIGYSLSHGCIRMHIPQAEWLFDHVTVGTAVFIVPQ